MVLAARVAGLLDGHPREKMVEKIVRPMILSIPIEKRVNLSRDLAVALYPNLAKAAATTAFNKWLRVQEKSAAENADGDGELPKVETLGGWYPDETCEICHDMSDLIIVMDNFDIFLGVML